MQDKDDIIFEQSQQINRLSSRITYLQEELASAEDEIDSQRVKYEQTISMLEHDLGEALYGH
jgi:hypothetical protein